MTGDRKEKMSYISAVTKNNRVYVWERLSETERIVTDYPAPYYFYYDDEDGEYRTIYDTRVSKAEFDTSSEYYAAKKEFDVRRVRTWESDVPPEMRVLSNHYYGIPAPKLNVTLFDIEVDYDPEMGVTVQDMVATNPYAPINSVSLIHCWKKEIVVLCVPPEEGWDEERLRREVDTCAPDAPIMSNLRIRYVVCADERELLMNFLVEIEQSDVIGGWNSDFFDVPYTAQRIVRVLDNQEVSLETAESINEYTGKLSLTYAQNPNPAIAKQGQYRWLKRLDFPMHGSPTFRAVQNKENGKLMGNTLDLVGRIRIDYMNLVKKYEPGEKPSYKLEAISEEVLVDDKTGEPTLPKLTYEKTLRELYRENFPFFVRYNIRDTEILYGFEQKLGYIDIANVNYHLSTGLMPHVLGTLKLAELALVNYCHHELRRVVNNVTEPEVDRSIDGALVLFPQIGLHEWVGSIDINSLYPSAIRSLNISPETLRGQFKSDVKDFIEIAAGSFKLCTMVLEHDKSELTMPASEWRDWLAERNWAISGYGTVFDQTKQGFIPGLLANWYDLRKKYQKMKKEAGDVGDYEKAGYYDRLQYVYKIKLNSLYGALTNLYFRFYDLRLGESTTGSGRIILKHQCRTAAEALGDSYDSEFPLYETLKDAMESGYTEEEARLISMDGPVFNGKHHSEAVIYGDTDSTYFRTFATSQEEAIKVADMVADIVNKSYPDFMRNTFLCTPGYDDIIKAGREIVSDKGIFVDKKRYILHLVDLDGKPVDKMKVMGLDTKKTTLPADVSKKLNGFIERYLKGETWEDISVSIVDYKTELTDAGTGGDLLRIGLPKGVKKLEDYSIAYDADIGTRLPGHVAAAIHYNQCLKQYNDKNSAPIVSGMKLKVYYLKNKNGRFKSIALPTDTETVPPWFNIHCNVDVDAHIERLVDNPLANILKAINKRPPSKQSLFVDSLLEF
jgi:DNA polymerase elongation subunit (family B)